SRRLYWRRLSPIGGPRHGHLSFNREGRKGNRQPHLRTVWRSIRRRHAERRTRSAALPAPPHRPTCFAPVATRTLGAPRRNFRRRDSPLAPEFDEARELPARMAFADQEGATDQRQRAEGRAARALFLSSHLLQLRR